MLGSVLTCLAMHSFLCRVMDRHERLQCVVFPNVFQSFKKYLFDFFGKCLGLGSYPFLGKFLFLLKKHPPDFRIPVLYERGTPGVLNLRSSLSTLTSSIDLIYRGISLKHEAYGGSSLIRKCPPLGPYSRPVPKGLWWY